MTRRELAPDEVLEIAALAADFPDLRVIRPLIATLRQEIDDAKAVTVDAYTIRPQSVKDLLMLLEHEVVSAEWVKARLPGRGTVVVADVEARDPDSEPGVAQELQGVRPYVITDRRARASA